MVLSYNYMYQRQLPNSAGSLGRTAADDVVVVFCRFQVYLQRHHLEHHLLPLVYGHHNMAAAAVTRWHGALRLRAVAPLQQPHQGKYHFFHRSK